MAHHKDGLLDIPANAQIVASGNPTTPAWNDFHHPTFQDLFPAPPSAYDVRQGGIGDCWLLSALISILAIAEWTRIDRAVHEGRRIWIGSRAAF